MWDITGYKYYVSIPVDIKLLSDMRNYRFAIKRSSKCGTNREECLREAVDPILLGDP